ncbi:MAG: 4-(cytidine 5'-diphospho)-2-C-methyl-D-erythritol kinase [Vulcanimicrobiota bacterium]
MKDYELKMIAPAKINYILEVGSKRKDGYHDVLTIFQTVSLYDELYFKELPGELVVTTDSQILEEEKENLVYKSAELLKRVLKINRGAHIHLKKKIPIGAGLGGGSSDAATAIKGLSRLWGLKLSKEDMFRFATSLGSDVPFFVNGGIAIGRGRGEIVSSVRQGAKPRINMLLVCPDEEISSAWAYQKWDEEGSPVGGDGIDEFMKALFRNDFAGMVEQMHNDFEPLIFKYYPVVEKIKVMLRENGALGSLMSGSGPTVFGIFDNEDEVDTAAEKLRQLGRVFTVRTV